MKKSTTSVLLWEAQIELLHFAATRHDMNVSEYVRDILIPLAAKEAGRPVPIVPPLERIRTLHKAKAESGTFRIDYDELASKVVDKMTAMVAGQKK